MRSLLVLTMLATTALSQGCATLPKQAARAGETLTIRKVGISSKTFSPEKGEGTVIRWAQTQKARTVVEIRKENGELVRRLENIYPTGDHEVHWDGKNDISQTVDAGVYLYVINSQGEQGREIVHDPSLTTGGEELKVERFTFDREKRELNFVLPRAARVRLRIGLSPFLHLRTPFNWDPMEAGAHTFEWDGLDESGWIRAIDHPDLSINLTSFALPDNAIIVKSEGSRQEGYSLRPPRDGLYLHMAHDGLHCRDISFEVEFPNASKNEESLPVLGHKTLVRVRLNEADRNFMLDQRFEVMFFVDTLFLFEEEEGQNPFNFEWDTTGLAPGEHLLTVNLVGYEDHLGVKTVRVIKQ